ncbi:hypothetical protein [Nostoc sp. 'Peltigera membranacea cyanobiont' 210A]|uniref:hypothetical protein n=1 Tax=Nostoc sp. 'Peltigera membranacea cyanobiont' 210A TaxID=2014529 RepID=UPI00117BF293|nr:hypothetical protein [Nostoc sp. 'Peltigera membranacea cyanobiont' 210A]
MSNLIGRAWFCKKPLLTYYKTTKPFPQDDLSRMKKRLQERLSLSTAPNVVVNTTIPYINTSV